MTRFLKVVLLLVPTLFTAAVNAQDLLVNAFLESRPFSGVELEVNGRLAGVTGQMGEVTVDLSPGKKKILFLKNGIPLSDAYEFTVGEGENVELSVVFSNFDDNPTFNIERYAENAPPADEVAATGTIGGEIRDNRGRPIAGAIVSADGTEASATSDADGLFELSLPRGTYDLVITHPEHQTVRRDGFRVVSNIGLAVNVRLTPQPPGNAVPSADAAANLPAVDDELVVTGTYRRSEDSVSVEKFSAAITSAISIDDLLRSGDSDVAEALKRLVGVSVTDGRYAVVRGLDGRYIAATLNGSLMPSTDPFRRDVQLDLFPADILSGIEIQKTFSANLPGDTTGGIVRITTRGMPEEYVNKVSASVGYTTDVTGERVGTYRGGDSDRLGFDDGTRELPGIVRGVSQNGQRISVCQVQGQQGCVQPAEAATAAIALSNIWAPGTETAGPAFGLGYTLGNVFDRPNGRLGLYGTASYDRDHESEIDATVDDSRTESNRDRDSVNTDISGYFVGAYESDNGWSASSKTLVLRDTENTTIFERGRDKIEDQLFNQTTLSWIERQYLGQQFEGSVALFDTEHELVWRAGYSQTNRYAPDRRSYGYRGVLLDLGSIQRSYSDLTEDSYDLGLDYKIPFDRDLFGRSVSGTLTAGLLANRRERDTELIRLGYQARDGVPALDQDIEAILVPETFNNDAIRLIARTAPTDSYEADQDALAAYVSTEANIGDAWTVVAGLRQDRYEVDIRYPNGGFTTSPGQLESDELLPALAVIYRPLDQWQLRFGYSATVSRPNITEIARSRFFDEDDRLFFGGCESSTQSQCLPSFIDNFDVRAEYYFGDNDSVSLALFNKQIDDPLEVSLPQASGSANIGSFAFSNGDSATVQGIEIDLNKTFLERQDYSVLLGANIAFIDSETTLSAAAANQEGGSKRDLQGQSPVLANMQVTVDHFPWDQQLTVLLNYFDDRIDRAARGALGSIVEAGRFTVNLNYEKGLTEQSSLNLRVQNLLDEDVEFTQNGRVIERWRDGVEVSLGYSWNFAR
jgi:TonB-dependent receptor